VSLRHADAIVVVSDVLKEECASRGIPPERVIVQPNGMDPAIFDPGRFPQESVQATRARLGIPPGAVVVTFLGTYGMWHGAEVFAAAARRLIDEGAAAEGGRPLFYLFVGEGLRMPEVRAQFAGSGRMFPVRFAGLVPQAEAPEYLAASDILVSPHVKNPDGTRFFGSPTKLFEYMAMGKPIAASDLEQIGQVLANSYRATDLPEGPPPADDGRLAVLSAPGDLEELVKSLRFLATRPDYRRILGANARREALARYTWDAAVEHMIEALPKALRS
jgi:glycosyltransferase involved in cell wall biosynthesis